MAPAPGGAVPEAPTYALIVGHNGAGAGEPTLRYADDDAGRFYELVASHADGAWLLTSFDAESQELFEPLVPVAAAPTRAAVLGAMASLRERVAKDVAAGLRPQVYFYYAGHGEIADGSGGYVHLEDGRLTREALSDELLTALEGAWVHVVVDACNAYFLVADDNRAQGVAFSRFEPLPNVGYVLSTSSDARSHEWQSWSGGVFSHEVRSAMVGAADANLDGAVDYRELAAFVAVANESIPQARFRPAFYVQPPRSDLSLPITTQSGLRRTSNLWLDIDSRGRLEVRDRRGLPYADVNKAPGRRLAVWLEPLASYSVRFGGKPFHVPRARPRLTLAMLVPDADDAQPRAQGHRAFQHAFGAPFGQEVVRGYRLGAGALSTGVHPDVELRRHATYGLLGGGGAALVASGILGALTFSAQQDAGASTDELAVATTSAFSVGIGALITAAVLIVQDAGR